MPKPSPPSAAVPSTLPDRLRLAVVPPLLPDRPRAKAGFTRSSTTGIRWSRSSTATAGEVGQPEEVRSHTAGRGTRLRGVVGNLGRKGDIGLVRSQHLGEIG